MLIVKLIKNIYSNDDYCIYEVKAGKEKVYVEITSPSQPKILKTVEYLLRGEWRKNNYGKIFSVTDFSRLDKVTYSKKVDKRIKNLSQNK